MGRTWAAVSRPVASSGVFDVKLYKQSDTSKVILIYLVDTSNNGVTGLTPTVTLSKNGGSFASPTGTVAEVGNGLYKLTPSADDVGTLGPLVVRATGTGAVTYMSECRVVAYDPYDSVRQGLTALPNATAGASGGVYVVGGTGVTVATNNDKTGYKLASDGLDSIPVETGVNARQALSPILAASAGVISGAGTGTIVIRGGNVATTRITASTDGGGNRTAVTLSLPA